MLTRRSVLLGAAGVALGWFTGCEPGPRPPRLVRRVRQPSREPASSGATPEPRPPPTSRATPTGRPRPRVAGTIADNLNVPWGIAFLASGDALISERDTARIRRVTRRGKVSTLGELSGVAGPPGDAEGGLLGIALAPDDEETLFAYLSTPDEDRVVRLSLAGGKIGKPATVLTGIPSGVRHHGGRLLFAPDGMLFVSTGDSARSDLAQDRNSLAGKILRIRPDGRPAPGNPFGNRTWSYGHRNIEGLAFDAQRRLWATEFGEQETDELNLISKGKNYGWPIVEGKSDNSRFARRKRRGLRPAPVRRRAWPSPGTPRSSAPCAVECVFAVPLPGERQGSLARYFAEEFGRIRNAVVAPDGALWMTTSNTDGRADPGRDDDKIIRVTL